MASESERLLSALWAGDIGQTCAAATAACSAMCASGTLVKLLRKSKLKYPRFVFRQSHQISRGYGYLSRALLQKPPYIEGGLVSLSTDLF